MEYRNINLYIEIFFFAEKFPWGKFLQFSAFFLHVPLLRPAFTSKQLVPALTLRLRSSFRNLTYIASVIDY